MTLEVLTKQIEITKKTFLKLNLSIMSKEIYLVVATFGSYDDYGTVNIKSFHKKEDAERYSEKYKRVIKSISDFCAECWRVVSEEMDDVPNEEYDNWFEVKVWAKYNSTVANFNLTKIETIELL